ncbi:C39 family peptidase [Methylomarinum sp. Ch1-1]|uniref:C39 family peptidase n=1 Tax=Methylomarinum roseum TaxID=3067653 RepID=A0AAU7NSK2_9GAMM|nr:C39 family peptidase [Methylomarinum sp. Ch1-1]MDP4520393.1 C39 family peptidase [Methylomarinum sp. Ch1-1]
MKHLILAYVLAVLPVMPACAGSIALNGIAGGGNYNVSVTSFKERLFKTVYRQQFDFSCGSAALASLLTFHYEDNVNEQHVFLDMYRHGDQEKIKKLGFSLLDMKLYLERKGYSSDGFRINLDQLTKANVPAITIINNNGYMHFVLIKGVSDTEVLVGDPAVGVKAIDRDKFSEIWNHRILFLIHDKQELAANHFQDRREWALRVKAPLGTAVDRSSLADFNLLQPGNFDL